MHPNIKIQRTGPSIPNEHTSYFPPLILSVHSTGNATTRTEQASTISTHC
jgi:hypothetical protein